MTDTAARVAGPDDIPNSDTTLYTVPSSTQLVVRNIHIANTTSSAANIRLTIGSLTAAHALLWDFSVPANGSYDWDGFEVLEAAETIHAQGGTNNALTVTIAGVLIT